MAENLENLVLEHLKAIPAELSAARDRDAELLRRLSSIEAAVGRVGRDQAHTFAEQMADRHSIDALRERLERIERRLELIG
jgi:hypothetical protein